MAIKKKKSSGGGANWMDTYGDMVTLLLCFFVLLYSMSTISEDNLRAIVMSFNPNAAMAPHETEGNEGPVADPDEGGQGLENAMTQSEVDQEIESLFQALQTFVSQEGVESDISVTKGDGMVYISFNQAIFFEGDSPVLLPQAFPILDHIGGMLTAVKNSIEEVRVLGHTAQGDPGKPNDPVVDRTLSSSRATNVVIYVQTHSEVDPARLISEGYGQHRPKTSNETPEGRAENRRVEMIISGRNIERELEEGLQQYYVVENAGRH